MTPELGFALGFAGIAIGLALTVAVLVWKRSGDRVTLGDLRRDLSIEQAQSHQYATTIKNQRAQLRNLRTELEGYDEVMAGGDRDARRAFAKRVLSLAQDRVPDGAGPELHGEGGGVGGEEAGSRSDVGRGSDSTRLLDR